jgi:hypothetical protein
VPVGIDVTPGSPGSLAKYAIGAALFIVAVALVWSDEDGYGIAL